MGLTQPQRRAMHQAIGTGIWTTTNIQPTTIQALEQQGLVELVTTRKRRQVWRPTPTGLQLVAAAGLTPTFLHQRSQYGYTHQLAQALPHEPEVIV